MQLASSSLLRLGQEADRDAVRNRESVYLLLDQVLLCFNLFVHIYYDVYITITIAFITMLFNLSQSYIGFSIQTVVNYLDHF